MPASDDVEIRPYRKGDGPGVVALFNEVFAAENPGHRERTLAEWRWEFVDNPAGTQVVLGIEPGGRVVAQYACLPSRVWLDGRTAVCGEGIDSVVHPEYRRGLKREGLFLRVARYYFEHYGIPEKNAFGYGFPNEKAFRLGTRMLAYVPVFAPLPTLGRNLFALPDDAAVTAGATTTGEIVEIQRFDSRADELWLRLRSSFPMAIERTAAYLNWRYSDAPFPTRAFGLFERDTLRGFCVTRPDWTGPPILALTELLAAPDDEGAIARLLAHAVRLARETEQARVETWIPPTSPLHGIVTRHGFTEEPSPFNLCIKIYDPTLEIEWVKRNWYFSIGDSDSF